jgi:hypothetical protein
VALHEGAYLEHCRKHALTTTMSPVAVDGVVSHHVTGD